MFVACGSQVTFNSFHISPLKVFIFLWQGISYFPTFISAFALCAVEGTAFGDPEIC